MSWLKRALLFPLEGLQFKDGRINVFFIIGFVLFLLGIFFLGDAFWMSIVENRPQAKHTSLAFLAGIGFSAVGYVMRNSSKDYDNPNYKQYSLGDS